MRLLVKNMVCPRCISAVRDLLVSEGLTVISVSLGDVEIEDNLSDEGRHSLADKLRDIGFELLDDPRSQLVEQIRVAVLKWVRMEEERPKLSECLSRQLSKDYSALSKLFSEMKGVTIELLCYSQLSTSEIAYRLGYSSPAYLSSQFKQVTGMTPKDFRELGHHKRISLDAL